MAELITLYPVKPTGGIEEYVLTKNLDEYGKQFVGAAFYVGPPRVILTVQEEPVSPAREVRSAYKAEGYYADFYNRVHIKPPVIDLGNLLGSTYVTYTVWNAHIAPKTMSEVSYVGSEGINVTSSKPVPSVLGPTEEVIFSLEATLDGPPTVQAKFSYLFPTANDVSVNITGRRILVWPFMPETDVRETYEFSTDVIKSYSGEQRVSLRLAPRQSIEYVYKAMPSQFARMKNMAKEWTHRRYGVPVWYEATSVGNLAANSTTLTLDTSNADYRVGGLALVWSSDMTYEPVEIVSLSPSSLTIKRPLLKSYSNALIAPMRLGHTTSGVSFSRTPSDLTNANVKFEIVDNEKLTLSPTSTTYRGHYVVTDTTLIVGNTDEQVTMELDILDNSSGIINVDLLSSVPVRRAFTTTSARTKAERWKAKAWYHYLNGRQKVFWLPTWNTDLELVEPISSTAQTLVTKYTGFASYVGQADIMVVLVGGATYYNRVLSSERISDDRENLLLESPFPIDIAPEHVYKICHIHLMRLDSDTVEFSYSSGVMETSVATIEVNE